MAFSDLDKAFIEATRAGQESRRTRSRGMKYGSVCSGIEAASVAWEPLGMTPVWFSEFDAFPSAVLAHHWPHVDNLGDMTKLPKRVLLGEIEAPDVLVGGTPCQSFSVAGLREGFADERGQLTIKYVELLDAIDTVRVRAGKPAAIAVWENVPGVLSDKNNAFGCFLGALAGDDRELQPSGKKWTNAGCVYGPQRAVAWRVLDAQYFGVAQRRRRVFVVASARADTDPAAVLFEREGVRRDTAPRREAGKGTTADARSRVKGPIWPADIASTFSAAFGDKLGLDDQHIKSGEPLFVPSYNAVATTVVHGTQDPCVSDSAAFALGRNNGGENAVATMDVAGTMLSCANSGGWSNSVDHAAAGYMQVTPDTAVRRLIPIECERLQGFSEHKKTFSARVFNRGLSECSENQVSLAPAVAQNHRSQKPVLNAEGGESQSPARHVEQSSITCRAEKSELAVVNVLIDLERQRLLVSSAEKLIWSASIADPESESLLPIQGEDFARLAALMTQTAAPATHSGKVASQEIEISSSNLLSGRQRSELCGREIEGLASDAEGFTKMVRGYLKSTTLQAGRISQTREQPSTTLFCYVAAAINGFIPEKIRSADSYSLKVTISYGHTAVPYRNKPAADGPRYKAIGNSMAVPCMAWIGARIQIVTDAQGAAA